MNVEPKPTNDAIELAAVTEQLLMHFNVCHRRGTFESIAFNSLADAEICRILMERMASLTNSFLGNSDG